MLRSKVGPVFEHMKGKTWTRKNYSTAHAFAYIYIYIYTVYIYIYTGCFLR